MTRKPFGAFYVNQCLLIYLTLTTPSILVSGTTMATTQSNDTPVLIILDTVIFEEEQFDYVDLYATLTYEWNQSKMSAQEYREGFCFQGCSNNKTILNSLSCRNLECFPCDCNKPACQVYGTCCPDISSESVETGDKTMTSEASIINEADVKEETNTSSGNEPLKLTCQAVDSDSYTKFLFIHSCPKEYSNFFVREMCESVFPIDETTVETFKHVSDNETNVSYWNEYCAICNQVSQIVRWQMKIECNHYLRVYTATTEDELLRLSLRSDSECIVSQKTPDHLNLKYCSSHWYEEAISECNVTGKWLNYDEAIENECKQNQDLYKQMYSEDHQLYRNIFCFICNANTFPTYQILCDRNQGMISRFPPVPRPFSLLLNFQRKYSGSNFFQNIFRSAACSDQEWASPSGNCRTLECSPGKVLESKNCSTALQEIRGLGYSLHYFYLLNIPNVKDGENMLSKNRTLHSYVKDFQSNTMTTLSNFSSGVKLQVSAFFEEPVKLGDNHLDLSIREKTFSSNINQALVLVNFYFTSNANRDDYESKIISELISDTFYIEKEDQVSASVTPMPVLSTRDLLNCSSPSLDYPKLQCFSLEEISRNNGDVLILFAKDEFITLTAVITCAHINFNSTEYVLEYDNTVFPPFRRVTLYFDSNVISHIDFNTEQELNRMTIDEDGTLKICEDLLRSKVSQIIDELNSDEDDASTMTIAQYILTLICVSLSMICLLLTLITYFLFPVLRSAAGQNNIFLCLTLLLAQASLLASSHVKGPSTFCTVLGISTHFLWLSMFCWSFTCCWNMFRVFTSKIRKSLGSTRSERLFLIKKMVFCALVPALTVTAVIVTITVTSHGNRIGYGDNVCYLDSGLLVGVAMVAPIGVMLLCNLFFFTLVVIKIHSVKKLQKDMEFHKDDRNNLYVYIKLSTLTGAFWSLVIIAEITENDTLRILSIVLNGLQGVFIFLSYVCNNRVLHLYLRMMGMEKYINSTSTEKSTIHKLQSEMRSEKKSEKEHSNKNATEEGLTSSDGAKDLSSVGINSLAGIDDKDVKTEENGDGRNHN